MTYSKVFNFGENWELYSQRVLDESKIEEVKKSLAELLGKEAFKGKSFLDVGCGTGIFCVGASLLGAKPILGIDINPKCIEVARKNIEKYTTDLEIPKFVNLSILDENGISKLGQFDIVYAWGSLHHTGRLIQGITVAAEVVAPNGVFVLAVYNRHFTSPIWKFIKWLYNLSPIVIKKIMYYLFVPIIFLAKFAVTGKNPLEKERGMNFFIDVIDWIGGYPYEYASPEEIINFVCNIGFKLERTILGNTPIGCNEFIFRNLSNKGK